MVTQATGPIFILGVTPRSGTNFLMDLLCLHSACAPGRHPVKEDFFLEYSNQLLDYTNSVRACWDPMWGRFTPKLMADFRRALGFGLTSFLWVDRDRRLVTKTPSVKNLDLFFTFFPDAKLLILIRDGRSVVQSCMDTFGWEFDRATRMWRDGARTIARFQRVAGMEGRYRVLRYEDLIDDLRPTLRDTLLFLGLDPGAFDFEAAERLPVRGSSAFFGPERRRVHWDPVHKDSSFDPRERWRNWSAASLERFNWIAGDQLEQFGYATGPGRWRIPEVIKHSSLDLKWGAKVASRRGAYRIRGILGDVSRPVRAKLGWTHDS